MKNTQLFKKQVISSFILSLIALSAFAAPLKADTLWNKVNKGGLDEIGKTAYETTGAPKDVRLVTARIIKVFLGLLGIIFLTLIVFAGFRWMNSHGNEEEIKKAKDQLAMAVIGLVIILAAYSIANFVTGKIYNAMLDNMDI
jgi:hypothetical protein